jgi:hypothetical protein
LSTRPLALAGVLLVSVSLIAWRSASTPDRPVERLIYTSAPEYDLLAWMQGGERFPRGATLYAGEGVSHRKLVTGFYASADANVSFDGERVLFSGKRQAHKPWQVWEATVANGKVRQLTHCSEDCLRPLYLPAARFVYAHKIAGNFVLEAAQMEGGGGALPLSFGSGNFLPSDVLRDGRILFQAAFTQSGKTTTELYTVYSDGSGVEAYRCDHPGARYAGKQVSSGDVIFVRAGDLFRFTSSLAHDIAVAGPQGEYAGDVAETPDGAWLVSWRNSSNKKFELWKWQPGSTTFEAQVAEPDANVIEPAWLVSRPVPNRHPSGLHEWAYANLLCLSSYTSKYEFKDGSIASVRLYTRDAQGKAQIQGTANVEKDGSFYLRVPGDRPLKIELLDSSGKTLKKEAGWFWMRKGEQRICVGCHAGPETAPENAVPQVLLRSTVPADLSATSGHATRGGN